MDCVARRLGMDPLDFRLKNLIEEGETTLTGGRYRGIKAKETLKAAAKAAGYKSPKPSNVGRGIAMGYRGPGAGNTALKIALNPDGSVVIYTSLFEQGTGTYTTMRQIAAEELSCDPNEIRIEILDTDSGVPFDSGIGGSRGTRVASGSVGRGPKWLSWEEISSIKRPEDANPGASCSRVSVAPLLAKP
jgi:CO/xanthine dehydrogenase Mo-binding subunit